MIRDKAYTVMFSAGEASGDQHAANMFLELKKQTPNVAAIGMGGAKMRQAGVDTRIDSSAIAVIGLIEVLKHYSEIKAALKGMKQIICSDKPDLLICVDYKEFNLKLAQYAKKQGVKVLFYVSPQVWAWRPGRVKTYGKAIDMMAVIFPFETAYYDAENVPVAYVGHPSVDKVHPKHSKADALKLFQLDAARPVVGLLPGSRYNEIKRLLPVMLEAAEKLAVTHPELQYILPQADSIADENIAPFLAETALPIKIIKHQPYDVIQCCDAVMTASGTASLEVALLQIPMVIVYKLSWLTYLLGRLLVKIPFIGLPNIIAEKGIVKELIQHDVNAGALAAEIDKLLFDAPYRQTMLQALGRVKQKLGPSGGSKNMADLAVKLLLKS